MLLPEEEGGEIDVGAGRCHVQEALEMKKTKENADEEEWDIWPEKPPAKPSAPKGDPEAIEV